MWNPLTEPYTDEMSRCFHYPGILVHFLTDRWGRAVGGYARQTASRHEPGEHLLRHQEAHRQALRRRRGQEGHVSSTTDFIYLPLLIWKREVGHYLDKRQQKVPYHPDLWCNLIEIEKVECRVQVLSVHTQGRFSAWPYVHTESLEIC